MPASVNRVKLVAPATKKTVDPTRNKIAKHTVSRFPSNSGSLVTVPHVPPIPSTKQRAVQQIERDQGADRSEEERGKSPADRARSNHKQRPSGLMVKQARRPRHAEIPRIAEDRSEKQPRTSASPSHRRKDRHSSSLDRRVLRKQRPAKGVTSGKRAKRARSGNRLCRFRDARFRSWFSEARFHSRVPAIKAETYEFSKHHRM